MYDSSITCRRLEYTVRCSKITGIYICSVSIYTKQELVHGYHFCIIFRYVVKRLGTEKLCTVTANAQMLCLKPIH
jgi:hypothetical protein